MDRELQSTSMGESFERVPPPSVGERASFSRAPTGGGGTSGSRPQESEEEREQEYRPVDVDLNLVRYLLESYSSQGAMPGPASTLLGEIADLSK